jgi:hypothetical protein
MSRHARADGGRYSKANYAAGEPPFLNKLAVEIIPVAEGYPSCFGVFDKGGKLVAYLTDMQVREALDKFDDLALTGSSPIP